MLTLKITAARIMVITLVIIVMVFTLAVYLQIQVLQLSLNWDSLWLLHCASAILQGKQYYYNFMETNPPLIMFFYMPALGVGALLGVTDYLGLYLSFCTDWHCFVHCLSFIASHNAIATCFS